jgi:heme O synthase-like polyprenyltransferase
MVKKVLANIILNIAIITLVFSIIWSFKNHFYLYGIIAVLALAMCIYLKVRLVKTVRELTQKNRD